MPPPRSRRPGIRVLGQDEGRPPACLTSQAAASRPQVDRLSWPSPEYAPRSECGQQADWRINAAIDGTPYQRFSTAPTPQSTSSLGGVT
jgi:hypothetical protein